MAQWAATYLGMVPIEGIVMNPDQPKPDLTERVLEAIKENKKAKTDHVQMTLEVTPESLKGTPDKSEKGAAMFYLPIGRVVFVHTSVDGSLKKAFLFSIVSVVEGYRAAKYACHIFKCKTPDDMNRVAFALSRTVATNAARSRPENGIDGAEHDDIEAAIRWWNASNEPIFHFSVDKEGKVVGNIKFQCQADRSIKSVAKVVRLSNFDRSEFLVKTLAEKFNLGDVDISDYAIFEVKDSGEETMLDEHDSPINMSLRWRDPAEGAFVLRKLPTGLVRVGTTRSPRNEKISLPSMSSDQSLGSHNSSRNEKQGDTHAGMRQDRPQYKHLDVPLLPYRMEDEDLLLNVMITRQSGAGLGFKLTPAYLLRMSISFCALHQGQLRLEELLDKICTKMEAVVLDHPNNPEMLLFWASNSMKLYDSLKSDNQLLATFQGVAEARMDAILTQALKSIKACANAGLPLPPVLESTGWGTLEELESVVYDYYRTNDANITQQSLQEIVNRVTAAMPANPSPERRHSAQLQQVPLSQQQLQQQSQQGDPRPRGVPMEALDPAHNLEDAHSQWKEFQQQQPGGPPNGHMQDADGSRLGEERMDQHPAGPLPEEWEELVDNETKHRFFANHITRQTSWTDPRDVLITVNLTKGPTGLGLGISGARRTWDDRLVLGIFVSSLVPGSAAAVDGSLHEGDELLEVNGQSLIGVSREEAIDFLKQVKQGETVSLLVAQEPRTTARLRHTAL